MRIQVLNTLLVIFLCFGNAVAQDDILANYIPGTIAQTSKSAIASTKKGGEFNFASEGFNLKARAVYKGSMRSVSPKKAAFLKKFLKDNEYPDDFNLKVKEEALFGEGNETYWLVMQNIVTPHFLKEVKAEDPVDLYIIFLGTVKDETGTTTLVALVNEFKRTNEERPSGQRTGKPEFDGGPLKGYERYAPRTLREIIDQHANPKSLGNATIMMTGDTFPSRVLVTYTGSSRPVTPERKTHLELLTQAFKVPLEKIARYDTELLFKENGQDYWLPVIKDLVPFFEKELKKDDEVILYAEWVGASKLGGKWDWVFIVHEFQKPDK